jgi:hypothetical protein
MLKKTIKMPPRLKKALLIFSVFITSVFIAFFSYPLIMPHVVANVDSNVIAKDEETQIRERELRAGTRMQELRGGMTLTEVQDIIGVSQHPMHPSGNYIEYQCRDPIRGESKYLIAVLFDLSGDQPRFLKSYPATRYDR